MADKDIRKTRLTFSRVGADSVREIAAEYLTADEEGRRAIGRRIRGLRKQAGYTTQKELAESADVAVETVHRIENGKNVETNSLAKVWEAIHLEMELEIPTSALGDAGKTLGEHARVVVTPEEREQAMAVAEAWLRIADPKVKAEFRQFLEKIGEALNEPAPEADESPASEAGGAGRLGADRKRKH